MGYIQTERQMDSRTDRHTYIQTDRHTRTYGQTEKYVREKAEGWTGGHTES